MELDTEMLARLAVALAGGLLVGLERGWQARAAGEGRRAAGLRTFALAGLLGGLAGAIGAATTPVVTGILFVGFAGVFAAFALLEARADGEVSATSAVAGLVTFAVGAYAAVGDLGVAVAAAVATTVLLALREPLHRWVASLTTAELRAVLTLAAMSFLMLPVIPNRAIDPWGAVNPAEIWMLAILIAGLSFVGYVGVKLLGDRLGILVAAATGGLASSTATTLALSRLAAGSPGSERVLAAGILLSGAVMVARVGVMVAVIAPATALLLAPALTVLAGTALVGAAVLMGRRGGATPLGLGLSNPLELGTALKLAALIAVVGVAVSLLKQHGLGGGVFVVAALSGLVDVDAATLSMARLSRGALGARDAAGAILLTVSVNTAAKTAIAGAVGTPRLALLTGAVGAVGVIGAAAALLA